MKKIDEHFTNNFDRKNPDSELEICRETFYFNRHQTLRVNFVREASPHKFLYESCSMIGETTEESD